MSRKSKILFIIYFIVVGIVIFTSDNLGVLANKLEYVQCGSATGIPKPVPQLTTIAYTLLVAGTPIVLIAFSIVTLVKATLGGNADEITKARTKLFKKFIIAAIIFLSASIVQFVLLKVTSNNNDRDSVTACLKCFLYYSSGRCPASDTGNDIHKGTHNRVHSNLAKPTTSNRKSNTTTSANNSNSTSGNNNSSNTTVSGNNSTSNSIKGTKTILVGDSRTVGICGFSNSYVTTTGKCRDVTGVAKGGIGYVWLRDTAIGEVNKIIANTNDRYNIVILLGMNNLGLEHKNSDSSVTIYSDIISGQLESNWKNHNVIFVSLGPINVPVLQGQWPVSQENIDYFNRQMKAKVQSMNKSNFKYCDIEAQLKEQLPGKYWSDNIHLNDEGSTAYYNLVMNNCL